MQWTGLRDSIFPEIRAQLPEVEFYIVGARPAAAVLALASLPGVTVTGSVPDVRPFLAHASLAVAPLRIARGIQNKVLEAMAMEKIAVVSPQAMAGISARSGKELFVANGESEFVSRILALLRNGSDLDIGAAARNRVLESYSWERSLGRIDWLLIHGTQQFSPMKRSGSSAKLLRDSRRVMCMDIQTPQELTHDSAIALDQQNFKIAVVVTLAAILAILAAYHETAWSMVSIWERSDTFAHGFLIFPFSAYLIWAQRKRLSALAPPPNPLALGVLAGLGFSWLLATLASVQVFEQFFLVAMIPAAVWAILGNRMVWALAFPLGLSLLAVPFGKRLFLL